MTAIKLEPMVLADFDVMDGLDALNGDDLSPPGIMQCWPLTDAANNAFRTSWSAAQQRELFLKDASVHFMKVVDEGKPGRPLLAVGRWHRYEKGFQREEHLPLELYGRAPGASNANAVKHGLIGDAHRNLITTWLCSRPEWTVHGPQWVLTTLKTRQPERRRGAGSLIIDWGRQHALEEGVPAYIEAVPDAKALYEKFGFRQVGTQPIDLRPYGLDHYLVLARMAADPRP